MRKTAKREKERERYIYIYTPEMRKRINADDLGPRGGGGEEGRGVGDGGGLTQKILLWRAGPPSFLYHNADTSGKPKVICVT
jgi:hypothetical protein